MKEGTDCKFKMFVILTELDFLTSIAEFRRFKEITVYL